MSTQRVTTASAVQVAETPIEVLDEVIEQLRGAAERWCDTGLGERIRILDALRATTLEAGPAWVAAAAQAKEIAPGSRLEAEDWGSGIATMTRYLSLLSATLEDIAATGHPQPPAMRTEGARVVVDVLPADRFDRLLFQGFSAETWLRPGISEEHARARMGRIYRPDHESVPQVSVVLGAGNVSSIGPLDALYQLFALDRVAILKMNPANAHLGPHIAEAFRPLIERDVLRIVYGGAEVGGYLTEHPDIDAVHVTGSADTYDAIVFGSGDAGRARKQRAEPRRDKPVTAELGNVTPVIVVPGPWSDRDLAFHGDNIASMLVHNAGFNCIAARMIVQHRAWSKRGALLDAVRSSLVRATPRVPYYPGADRRYEEATKGHDRIERFGPPDADLPFTLLPELDPDGPEPSTFSTEAFGGVLGEVALEAERSVPAFIDAAVGFCNERLFGTLAATILIHPRSLDDPEVAAALDRALERLRYGTIVVNHWTGAAYAFMSTPWGPYPGSPPEDIQSGTGVVHNTFLLEDVEKTIVRGPFRSRIKPPWFHDHRQAHLLLPRLAELSATGDAARLPGLIVAALRG
ncbi:MAG: aldehyde dehydrogenase family protein [Nitriliruptoraceae bacterium]